MLIPQYSIRRLLAGVAACSLVALIIAQGVQGTAWAVAMTAALAALVVTMLVYAALFAGVWLFGRLTGASRQPQQDPLPPGEYPTARSEPSKS